MNLKLCLSRKEAEICRNFANAITSAVLQFYCVQEDTDGSRYL